MLVKYVNLSSISFFCCLCASLHLPFLISWGSLARLYFVGSICGGSKDYSSVISLPRFLYFSIYVCAIFFLNTSVTENGEYLFDHRALPPLVLACQDAYLHAMECTSREE